MFIKLNKFRLRILIDAVFQMFYNIGIKAIFESARSYWKRLVSAPLTPTRGSKKNQTEIIACINYMFG